VGCIPGPVHECGRAIDEPIDRVDRFPPTFVSQARGVPRGPGGSGRDRTCSKVQSSSGSPASTPSGRIEPVALDGHVGIGGDEPGVAMNLLQVALDHEDVSAHARLLRNHSGPSRCGLGVQDREAKAGGGAAF
jgi:hypothetical protein